MNRAIPTTIFSLCLIALFMSLMVGVQSCGNKDKDAATAAESLGEKAEELADKYTEDEFFEEGEDSSDDTAGYQDNDSGSDDDDSYTTPAATSSSNSTSSSSNNSNSYARSSTTSGYLVVAGNYLLEDNADEMVGKLKKQGYRDAQKVVFDLSQYYTVIAGSYTSRSSASQIGSELKRKGIDNYVVTKK